jgi:hypothetical protein
MQLVFVRGNEISRTAKDTFVYSIGNFAVLFMSSETLEKDMLLKVWKYFSFHYQLT